MVVEVSSLHLFSKDINKLNLSTTLVVTLQKGLNDNEIGKIIKSHKRLKIGTKALNY